MTAWVMLELAGDRVDAKGDAILVRGDNTAVVSSNTRCGGARDKGTCLQMRMLGRLEVNGGWDYTEKYVPGVRNIPVDSISRWPRVILADKVRALTRLGRKKTLVRRAKGIFDTALQTKTLLSEHDDFPVGRNERRTSRPIRVREWVCPLINIPHTLLLGQLFASIVSNVHTRPCRNRKKQGRTHRRGGEIS